MKKKRTQDEREAYARQIVEAIIQSFAEAYSARAFGESLEGLLIKIDIAAAYNGTDDAMLLAIRRATTCAVASVDSHIPFPAALDRLQKQLDARLDEMLAKK